MDERWQNTLERFRGQKAAMGQETPVDEMEAEPFPVRDWRATGLEWALEAADYQALLGLASLADQLKRVRADHEAAAHRFRAERQRVGRRQAFRFEVEKLAHECWVVCATRVLRTKVQEAVGGEMPTVGEADAFAEGALDVFRRVEAEFAPSLG